MQTPDLALGGYPRPDSVYSALQLQPEVSAVLDWIVVPAAILMVAALVVCLATKPWLPRVSSVASGTMAACLGIVMMWAALSALEKGVFEGAAGSKILRHSVYRTQSPGAFWGFFTFFALPGFLLACYPLCAAIF